MASYRLSASVISRGDGRSAIAAAAYRSGERLVDRRTGETHDYRNRGGMVSTAILTPDHTPDWMSDRDELWNAVEAIETRKNAQLSREIQLSLPHELTPDEREQLVHDFVREAFVSKGMVADVAIHKPQEQKGENPHNHHAHVMLTMRELASDGFHEKKATPTARSWNSRDAVADWRKVWADRQNAALERSGHRDRVTHKSLADQGLRRLPQIHLGTAATAIKRRGGEHPRLDRMAFIERRNARLEVVHKGRLRQLHEAQREAAVLHENIRKAGLLGFWQKLSGKRRADLARLEDVKAERARVQADAMRVATQREANAKEQRAIRDRQQAEQRKAATLARMLARQKQQAANDPQRPPERSKTGLGTDARPLRPERPERPVRSEFEGKQRPERPTRPERLERPSRPERPARPSRQDQDRSDPNLDR